MGAFMACQFSSDRNKTQFIIRQLWVYAANIVPEGCLLLATVLLPLPSPHKNVEFLTLSSE